MNVSAQDLQRFLKGQMVLHDLKKGTLQCGFIKTIDFCDEVMEIELGWMLTNTGFPGSRAKWIVNDKLSHKANLKGCTISDLGNGQIQFNLTSAIGTISLYPEGSRYLNPEKIKGLAATLTAI